MPAIRSVGVCGAGAMGSGIAQVAAMAGHEVTVFDPATGALDTARGRIDAALASLAKKGKLSAPDAQRASAAIRWSNDLAALAECDLVIEAIVEDLEIKRSLYAQLETLMAPDAILASNTSSLPIARLARDLTHPQRFLGMHFFNPPTAMKLVEVVRGPATSDASATGIVALSSAWGKVPVPVADVPGFIVNRVARPFYAEGFRALQEQVAAAGAIDYLFRAGAGFRMGPLELSDFIGQDINFTVARSVFDSYFGQTRFTPQRAQASLVEAGWLGRKTGRGVHDYRDGAPSWTPEPREGNESAAMPALPDPSPSAEPIRVDEVRVMTGRGRTARDEAAAAGAPVAILDWYDPGSATAIGFAASSEAASDVARRMIAASGHGAVELADRPGLLVTRTLAQIANAAGDAVLESVSDEAGIDNALIFGANYPVGPCSWARTFGLTAICDTLANIAEATGQPMYAPSEYWRRMR